MNTPKASIFFLLGILIFFGMLSTKFITQFFLDKKNEKDRLVQIMRVVDHEYDRRGFDQESGFTASFEQLNNVVGGVCLAAQWKNENEKMRCWLHKGVQQDVIDLFKRGKQYKIENVGWQVFRGRGNLFLLEKTGNGSSSANIKILVDGQGVCDQSKQYNQVFYFYILINTIILTSIGFFRLARYFFKPLDNLRETADWYLKSGELVSPVFSDKKGFRQIQYALNCMIDQINADKDELKRNIKSLEQANKQISDSQQRLVMSEKLAAVGRLSAGVAHEIGNPLGIIQGYVELLDSADLTENERKQYVERAKNELDRISKMIRQLLDCARKPTAEKTRTSVAQLVEEVKSIMLTVKTECKIELETKLCGTVDEIKINHDDIYQVVLNCLFNAIDAIESKGEGFNGIIQFSTEQVTLADKAWVVLTLVDNGIGISEENLTAIWDPFYTTKDVGVGTGLGLSISHSIIEQAGGIIEISSICNERTEVKIFLPE